jgi:uroporphyrin-3 C-methyltransferase
MTTDADNDPVDAQPPEPEASAPENSAASPQSDGSADAESKPAAEPRQRGGRGVIVFAMALAFFAAGAAGFLWWQYREFYVALDRADGETEIALRDVRSELRGLEDTLGELGEDRAALVDVVEEVVDRVNEIPARFAALDERIAAMQGVSSDARGRWLRAQAEYYLNVANAELTLRHSRANAVAALELADRALLDAGSPTYAAVRERIAAEVLGLEAVAVPDIEGLSFSLTQLKTSIATLPMGPLGPDGREDAPLEDAPPGIGRLWQSVKSALAGMFRVERRDTSSALSLSRNQQIVVRRQVELELTLARAGLVEAMPELFAASIANARELLLAHFDSQDAGVEGAAALLDEMADLDVAPAYPDISGSLTLLRAIVDRDG